MGTRNLPRKTRKINTLIVIQNVTQLNNSNNNDNDNNNNNNDNNNNETYNPCHPKGKFKCKK